MALKWSGRPDSN